jgi:hypothetical protein
MIHVHSPIRTGQLNVAPSLDPDLTFNLAEPETPLALKIGIAIGLAAASAVIFGIGFAIGMAIMGKK